MSRCRSCDAEITWAVTQAGRKMPLDSKPHPDGNVVMTAAADPEHGNPVVRVLTADEDRTGPLYRSHFVTCPDAAAHRTGR